MTTRLDRRHFLASSAALALTAALPTQALAVTPQEGAALVNRAVAEINTVIASGKSEAAMINDFATIFDRYADTAYVASYALGNDRRRATPAQIQQFIAAFRGYVARKYGRRFREFIGGEIRVEGARTVNSWVEVQTTTFLRGQSPIRVDFHVSDRPGRPVFFNLIIEGVNMLLSERTEVGAMLDRRGGNIDQLIADLSRL